MTDGRVSCMSPADLARGVFSAYENADRDAIEALLAADFTFTSPYDDHIEREAYFERCWRAAGRFAGFDLKRICVDGEQCFVVYEAHLKSGATFRNTELFCTDGGQVRSIEVFFGIEPRAPLVEAERQIRDLIDLQLEAIRAKDTDGVMALCVADMHSFDVVPPLVIHGSGEVRVRLTQWFAAYVGPIETEIRDLAIETSGDVAFTHFLQRVRGTMTSGAQVDMWVRVTLGLRRVEGRWWILHEHMSDPFDPETGQGRTDLKPECDVPS